MELDLFSSKREADAADEPQCKGVFYRYRETTYRTKRGGYATTKTLTKLQRMSCKGCNCCAGLEECIETDWDNTHLFPVVLPDEIKDEDIISPHVVVVGTDWETGYADEWEVHATIVKDKK